ncbi:MAG: hypothetical protein ABIS17_13345 [Casimicrobiaceae bacterium]
MPTQPFTLAMYRVLGPTRRHVLEPAEAAAVGALIRHWSERTPFYSFGPWEAPEHIKAMQENPQAAAAFAGLQPLCETVTPSDFHVVRHVDARR